MCYSGLGIRSSVFRANRLFFAKNERMIDSLKKKSDSLIFGEQPKRFAHGRSFLVSDLSESLTLVSDLSDSLTSLIFGERPEPFAHIANPKRGNEQIAHFLNLKNVYKTY